MREKEMETERDRKRNFGLLPVFALRETACSEWSYPSRYDALALIR